MARIYPFRAFRYQTERAGAPLKNLVTQPYDKITPGWASRASAPARMVSSSQRAARV